MTDRKDRGEGAGDVALFSTGAASSPSSSVRVTPRGNPYIAGNPVGTSHAFIGRQDVLRDVLAFLRDPQHRGVVLYGQRRIGKTSILQHLKEFLPQRGASRAIYFDLQDKAALALGDIMKQMAEAIADALELPDPAAGPMPEVWFRDTWLPGVLDEHLRADESLVVLLDEFDVLADAKTQREASDAFFGYLRDLLERTSRLKFVFVIGRNLEDLSYLAKPLFKTLPSKHISLLGPAEAAELVRISEQNGTLFWEDAAVGATWSLSHGHPYLLQHLCWQIWQRARSGSRAGRKVSVADVEDAVSPTLDASRNALEWLWGGLHPAGRVVASALAKAGPGAISEEALQEVLRVSGVRVVLRELRDAPQRLSDWDILEAIDEGYRFRVELFRRWIAQFKPLSRVQQELDHVEPLAEGFYKTGEGLFKINDLDGAIGQLRKALAINPQHLRASELCAEILISQELWAEAGEILARISETYPTAVRPRLAQVLVAQARGEEDEEKKLELYKRVLEIDKDHAEALAGKRAIEKARGDRARQEGQLEQALVLYRASGLPELAAEVKTELEAQQLATVEQILAECEASERYEAALDVVRQAMELLPGLKDWKEEEARLTRAREIASDYQRALGALKAKDDETATALLANVIGREAAYKDAAKLLYEALSGLDIEALKGEVEEARYGRAQEAKARRTLSMLGLVLAGLTIFTGVYVFYVYRQWKENVAIYAASSPSASASTELAPTQAVTASASPMVAPEAPKCRAGMVFVPSIHDPLETSGICVDRTEVAVGEYDACVRDKKCQPAEGKDCNSWRPDRINHRMNCVTWSKAAFYCLSQDKRLPTEEEWKRAARSRGLKYLDLEMADEVIDGLMGNVSEYTASPWILCSGGLSYGCKQLLPGSLVPTSSPGFRCVMEVKNP